MEAFKTHTRFNKNIQAWFDKLPLKEGQEIEVIVIPTEIKKQKQSSLKTLEGTVIEYTDPFKPVVSEKDWEVIN
jgi:predicted DNA-binding antitoxin AbrB/MazE fold protein